MLLISKMQIFENLFLAKISWKHFLVRLFGVFIILGILFYGIIPLLLMFCVSETALDKFVSDNVFIGILLNIFPLICGLFFTLIKLRKELKVKSFTKAKTYFLIGILLLLLFPIRFLIIEFLISRNMEIIR